MLRVEINSFYVSTGKNSCSEIYFTAKLINSKWNSSNNKSIIYFVLFPVDFYIIITNVYCIIFIKFQYYLIVFWLQCKCHFAFKLTLLL